MKPFNLEEAKSGKPVCTRSGFPVRIIDYDALIPDKETFKKCILAQATDGEKKVTVPYTFSGRYMFPKNCISGSPSDLYMGNCFVGWINIDDDGHGNRVGSCIWQTREDADRNKSLHCVATIKIKWEEDNEN